MLVKPAAEFARIDGRTSRAVCCCLAICFMVVGCATERYSRTRDANRRSARTKEAAATKPSDRARDESVVTTANEDSAAGTSSPAPASPVIPPPSGVYPIDLSTALRLAEGQNPTIAIARAAVMQALAGQTAARVLLVPSLNAGGNLRIHTGVLQRSSGTILSLTEQSLYFGGGAGALAAGMLEVPMLSIVTPLTDAWFEPLAARQLVQGRQSHALATANDVLLDVAMIHIDLLGNRAILDAQRLTETQVYQVVKITNDYAEAGEGRKADADRALAEWKLRRAGVVRAEEELAVASARLANRLNLDPAVRLEPWGGPLTPIDLIPLDAPVEELVRVALQRRPDLAARRAAVAEADYRHREELARPWLPTLWTGFSGGAFGGGSNVIPPLMAHFGARTDFDVGLYWTFLNFGAGNLARQHRQAARVGEAQAAQTRTANRVREDVASARADALAAHNQINVARAELQSAEEGFRSDLDLSRQNLVRPIEVLNNLNLLGAARMNLVQAIVKYDQAQFRLFVALGSPPPLPNPAAAPVGPPPVTTPLHGAIASSPDL
jgi:outer membrane protein TolC